MYRYWIVFFSQTGSEINNIRKAVGRDPDLVVTNKQCNDGINEELLHDLYSRIVRLPTKPSVNDYKLLLNKYTTLFEDCVITLHGYLRIIPEFMCKKFDIYNSHPGDIVDYPELKGFNPQEKAFNMHLPYSGVVIHKVVPEVDSGEIVERIKVNIRDLSLEKVYSILHDASTKLWIEFLVQHK